MKLTIPVVQLTLNHQDGAYSLTLEQPTTAMKIKDARSAHDERLHHVSDRFTFDDLIFHGRLECVVGWTGITGEDGKPLPFSRLGLECLLRERPLAREALRAKLAELFA